MGREVRRVPADWQHPKHWRFNAKGEWVEVYQPMHDMPYGPAIREWIEAFQAWERGEREEYAKGEICSFWEWDCPPPLPEYYRPDWPEESRTHFMMYEDTSEGTPISPAFATPEELARWLADNGASAFGSITATYEQWLSMARSGWAPSAIGSNGIIMSGVAGLSS